MFKRLFYFIILLIMGTGCAAHMPVQAEEKTFSGVFEAPGNPKEVLYERVKIWMAQKFQSSKAVIEYENKVDGTIIGNGIIKYPCEGIGLECMAKSDWTVPFNMRVDVKDDKFRLTYTNLRVSWPASVGTFGVQPASNHEMWQKGDFDAVKPVLLLFGEDIKNSVVKEISSDKW